MKLILLITHSKPNRATQAPKVHINAVATVELIPNSNFFAITAIIFPPPLRREQSRGITGYYC